MPDITDRQFEEFVIACRKAACEYGLMKCSSGNMSWRVDSERMLVTASRSWMSEIGADQVAVCRIADGAVLNGKTPSVECGFHAGVLRARPDMNVVLHFQTPAATTLACCTGDVNYFVLPEIPYYIGDVAQVPFIQPGSEELAECVVEALTNHNMAQLANHGQVTVGINFDDALQKAVFFELACGVILNSGESICPLPSVSIESLVEQGKGRIPGTV